MCFLGMYRFIFFIYGNLKIIGDKSNKVFIYLELVFNWRFYVDSFLNYVLYLYGFVEYVLEYIFFFFKYDYSFCYLFDVY